MKTSRMMAVGVFAGLALVLLSAIVVASQEDVDPRILAYDKGPKTIDVSKYSKEMQASYKVFERKCSNCHTLARPINCEFVLEEEWERYVKRMMNKSGMFISAKQGREIYDFLVYDSKIRKKELYDKKKGG